MQLYRRRKRVFYRLTHTTTGLLLISLIHAALLLLLTLALFNISFVGGTEVDLFERTIGTRRLLLKADDKPDHDLFLFVNVAYARQLIDKLDADGFPIGNQDITDRRQLARFFRLVNQHPDSYTFIICDIRFTDPSPDDQELFAEMKQLERILLSYHQSEPLPVFDVPRGFADYITADPDDNFLKFNFITTIDGEIHETLPLSMYKRLHHATFRGGRLLSLTNGKLSLNSIILDFRIRNYDLLHGEYRPSYVHLSELLLLPDEAISDMVKDRIILIGDFEERDIHQTIFGETAGTLILLNAYLALANGDQILPVPFLVMLFLGYSVISYNIFSGKTLKKNRWIVRVFETIHLGELMADWASYLFIIGAFSVTLSLVFNLHVTILPVATYLTLLETLVEYFKRRHSLRRFT